MIAQTRVPIPANPGHPARHDYEYVRYGTANPFMLFAPLEGWRHIEVIDRIPPWTTRTSSKNCLTCISKFTQDQAGSGRPQQP
jgi:hypothetical protein